MATRQNKSVADASSSSIRDASAKTKKHPNPVDKHVGSRVRMRRMMINMSQEKLGAKLGITFQQIQKYEKGTNRIGASRLQQIANVLGVPPGFFFEGAPVADGKGGFESRSPAFIADFLAAPDGLALARAFTRIDDGAVRRRIVDLTEAILAMNEPAAAHRSSLDRHIERELRGQQALPLAAQGN